MADNFDAGKRGSYSAIPFYFSNATTALTNQDMQMAGSGTMAVMPHAGSLVGLGVRANAAVTGGVITVKVHSNSTEFADTASPALSLTTTVQASYGTVRPGAIRFAAGDKLGVSFSTTAGMQPTNTLDLDAVLYVVLDPV